MSLIIVKIGGSVVTQKESNVPSVNFNNLESIAGQLRDFQKKTRVQYILIHGAGSFGHPIVKQSGIDKGIVDEAQLFAFAQTQVLQNKLNCIVADYLHQQGIPAIPCQLSGQAVMEAGRLKSLNLDAIAGLVNIGMVPVSYGVPAYDTAKKCSILSGDQIAPYLAIHLGAEKIIEACDVEGIFTSDPKNNPAARLISLIDRTNISTIERSLTGSNAIDVTGGMRQKYFELVEAAKKGIPSQIVHFSRLSDALAGKESGTTIRFEL